MKYSYVYILTNKTHTTLYVGITSDLTKRIYQHKNKLVKSFTSRYSIDQLVYYEVYEEITEAIKREKQIKGGSRLKKIQLIIKTNPSFSDLSQDLL